MVNLNGRSCHEQHQRSCLNSGADEDPEGDDEAESDEDEEDSGTAFQTIYSSVVAASERLQTAGADQKEAVKAPSEHPFAACTYCNIDQQHLYSTDCRGDPW